MKPRLFRLLVIACIAAASLGSTLLISSGGPLELRATHGGK
jgi:hypothetical protein